MDQKPTSEQQELFQLPQNTAPAETARGGPAAKAAPVPTNPEIASRKPVANAGKRKAAKKKTVAEKMAGRDNARSTAGRPDRIELLLTFEEGQTLRKFAAEEGVCVRRIGPLVLAGIAAVTAARGRKEQK